MKILIIVASAREGSSRYIANCLKKKMKMQEVFIAQLSEYDINYCSGCLECDKTHRCNIDDDMSELLEKVKAADIFVFITPARYSLISGEGKVFIDRLNPTAVSGDIEGKKFIAIAVGQSQKGDEPDSIISAANSLVDFADNAGMNVLGKYSLYNCYEKNDIIKNKDVESICDEILAMITKL